MEEIDDLWIKFNEHSNKLAKALGRTSNLVGEYAEYLAHQYYGGKLLNISGFSADIETDDGKLYQVKSRKIKGTPTTPLNVIRSWEFDYLVVILFNEQGLIKKGLEIPVEIAKEYAIKNSHQNGWIITTTQKFLTDKRLKDISVDLSLLINSKKASSEKNQQINTSFSSNKNTNESKLLIILNPSNPEEFKAKLLVSKLAEIKTTYSDGRTELKKWNADRFKQSSNILNNIRSRPEYRSGQWQANNIIRVDVAVINNVL
ncbi:hypothetical protein HMY34_16725 [Thiothrix subterranea]|uniref:DUF6998 domain-containing protein n=1 Tax=Thiothrix subterranea TaxID=2735563 RepID=UPI00192B82A5|nr:hypothetical protein [Thiothrix subterranea]QQZ30266.1 hypothetical protein HMY34_16725 [Thiothrix subterranea]